MANVIPSVNSAALEAIQDRQVRDVLKQVVSGWQVRNGQSGSGENAFLTESDLKSAFNKQPIVDAIASALTNAPKTKFEKYTPVGNLINEMQAQIMADPQFISLGQRVRLIDAPETGLITRLDDAVTGISDEHENRVLADNVLVNALNTIWAAIGDGEALVQSGSSAIANRTGAIASSWNQVQTSLGDAQDSYAAARQELETVASKVTGLSARSTLRLDVGGFVTGYTAYSAIDVNGVRTSKFYVRAGEFAIGSPSSVIDPATGEATDVKVPFIITTEPRTINGITSPAGMYVSNAFIENGSIDNLKVGLAAIERANIKDLAVNTLKIQDESVIVPIVLNSVITSDGIVWAGEEERYCITPEITFDAPVNLVAIASWNSAASNADTNTKIRITVLGVGDIVQQNASLINGYALTHTASGNIKLPAGKYRIEVWFSNDWYQGYFTLRNWSCTLLGAKK
jgi:hypothetical protein